MKERVLILGAQFEFCELVRQAKSRGYYTVVCDGFPNAPAKALADQAYTIDVRNIDEIVEVCHKEKVSHVITSFSDIMFECMIRISQKAGLPCYVAPDQLPAYRQKPVTKEICRRAGIKVPRFTKLKADFTDEEVADFRFPALTKPLNGYGSRGICVVNSPNEIREKFQTSDVYQEGTILLEEISKGQELNVMAFVVDGEVNIITIADRQTQTLWEDYIPVLYAVEYPSHLFSTVYEPVKEMLTKFITYTGQQSGPISTQCFWTGEEIEVCEIAGRFFGLEHELATYCTGIDIEKLLLDHRYDMNAVRETFAKHDPAGYRFASGVYLNTIADGVIADQSSLREICSMPHVVENVIFYEDGETVTRFGPKAHAARYYVVTETREEMDQALAKIMRTAKLLDADGNNMLFAPNP